MSGKGFRPEESQIKVTSTVIQFIDLAGRRLVFIEELSGCVIETLGQDLRFGVAGFFGQVFQGNPDREKFPQRIPTEVSFLYELLDVLGRGPSGTRLE